MLMIDRHKTVLLAKLHYNVNNSNCLVLLQDQMTPMPSDSPSILSTRTLLAQCNDALDSAE